MCGLLVLAALTAENPRTVHSLQEQYDWKVDQLQQHAAQQQQASAQLKAELQAAHKVVSRSPLSTVWDPTVCLESALASGCYVNTAMNPGHVNHASHT